MAMRWLALGLLTLSGCFPLSSEGECTVDSDCGGATYDKMPPRFDTVSINAHDVDETVLDSAVSNLQPGENVIDFDLTP